MSQACHALTKEDKKAISQYISSYAGCEVDDLDSVLSTWNASKLNLFSMFGNKLRVKVRVKCSEVDPVNIKTRIAKKEPCILLPMDNIDVFMSALLLAEECFQKRMLLYIGRLCLKGLVPFDDLIAVKRLFLTDNLYSNKTSIYTSIDLVYGGSHVKLSNGMRTMRAIQKVANLYGYPDMDDFCAFRDGISEATSVKKVDRDLVLSIHPIDYLTMSDNNCGWSSCLSWQSNGSSSTGAIEMLNSCNTVVAYFENEDEDFVFNGYKIPNKSFRVLVTLGDGFTLVGKSYPYGSDAMSKAILKAVDAFFGFKRKNLCERYDYSKNKLKIITFGMYNDLSEDSEYRFWWSNDFDETQEESLFSISGIPTCMSCGGKLTDEPTNVDWDRVGGNVKYCKTCEEKRCVSCGHIHRPRDLKKIDIAYFFPSQKTVTHKIRSVCPQCLNMDYLHISMNSYIDKKAHTCYNGDMDYRDWKHMYI